MGIRISATPPRRRHCLELIWGEGFLSPGGTREVARIVNGHRIAGCVVLDIGSGAGGADLALVRDHGAKSVVGVDVQPELVDLATSLAPRAPASPAGSATGGSSPVRSPLRTQRARLPPLGDPLRIAV